jgi:hypothetical protein
MIIQMSIYTQGDILDPLLCTLLLPFPNPSASTETLLPGPVTEYRLSFLLCMESSRAIFTTSSASLQPSSIRSVSLFGFLSNILKGRWRMEDGGNEWRERERKISQQ